MDVITYIKIMKQIEDSIKNADFKEYTISMYSYDEKNSITISNLDDIETNYQENFIKYKYIDDSYLTLAIATYLPISSIISIDLVVQVK